jgi:alpha-amylase
MFLAQIILMSLQQAFEWYVPADGNHWKRLRNALPDLKATGCDSLWIPPACKASSPNGNGYDIYDLYDLGEFDAKGSVRTKWGTKKELLDLCRKANEVGVAIYFDAVLNHKAAADNKEKCRAQPVNPDSMSSQAERDETLILVRSSRRRRTREGDRCLAWF